jgi:hypothetical protein
VAIDPVLTGVLWSPVNRMQLVGGGTEESSGASSWAVDDWPESGAVSNGVSTGREEHAATNTAREIRERADDRLTTVGDPNYEALAKPVFQTSPAAIRTTPATHTLSGTKKLRRRQLPIPSQAVARLRSTARAARLVMP